MTIRNIDVYKALVSESNIEYYTFEWKEPPKVVVVVKGMIFSYDLQQLQQLIKTYETSLLDVYTIKQKIIPKLTSFHNTYKRVRNDLNPINLPFSI